MPGGAQDPTLPTAVLRSLPHRSSRELFVDRSWREAWRTRSAPTLCERELCLPSGPAPAPDREAFYLQNRPRATHQYKPLPACASQGLQLYRQNRALSYRLCSTPCTPTVCIVSRAHRRSSLDRSDPVVTALVPQPVCPA